jgi:type II secretory pathway pseudopilin PulG
MKLNITPRTKRKSGMTLLELTVVILVLLSLIAVLFIGAKAWKKGADRTNCLIVIRNIQVAMRGDQNMRNSAPGAAGLDGTKIHGTGDSYIQIEPTCPADKTTTYDYIEGTNYPDLGKLYAKCKQPTYAADHVYPVNDVKDW